MFLQDYYKRIGGHSLTISLYFLFIAIVFTTYSMYMNNDVFAVSIFLFFSFLYNMGAFYYFRKSISVSPQVSTMEKMKTDGCYLLKRDRHTLYFFTPKGMAPYATVVKKQKNGMEIQLLKGNVRKETIRAQRKKDSILFENPNQTCSGFLQTDGRYGYILTAIHEIVLTKVHRYEWELKMENRLVARLQIGWLPVPYTSIFPLNTPFIRFYERFDQERQKEACFILFSLLHDTK
ncbi:hypothetical protein [Fervidibacillus albus]|uniref:Uncharacterized protein n=1 Tax=Fervidibacillus albus TaxID=2980026 RepID=A0A9E8LXU4_9BACI|nr:hypothetical protein [Fervidibacillus albus]WAA11051.1 hypothetical protein OE104_07035 [Fervidibacillus albus]